MSFEPGGTYDLDGEPCSFIEWCELHADLDNIHVRDTRVNEVRVSTVWIGIWILPEEFGAPMLYETLVFGGPRDGRGERYPNRVAALAGHDRWVAEVCDARPLGDPWTRPHFR